MTRRVRLLQSRLIVVVPLLGMLASACNAVVVAPQDAVSGLVIDPLMASLPPGGTATFVALARGAIATGVEWSASGGSITNAGVYTAPTELGSYQIQARVAGVTGVATATVVAPGTPAALYASASATCANMPLRSTGTIYYFCDCQTGAQSGCVAGNDANPGTSASPKQTWGAAMSAFATMNGGDTIALCKGGAWSASSWTELRNTSCTAGATAITDPANTGTCDLRDYPPAWGGTAKPIIRQTAVNNLMTFNGGAQHGIRILNLDFEGGGDGAGGAADVGQRALGLDDGVTDVFVCNNTFNGWYLGVHAYPYDAPIARMTFRGNSFTLNSLDAFLGGGSDLVIDANYFNNNGGSGSILWHTIYVQGLAVERVSVTNNVIQHTTIPCSGADISFHDQMDYINIENNYVNDTAGGTGGASCWAISVIKGDYPNAEYFRHLTVRRNLIDFGGWCALSIGEAPDAIIENNVIISRRAIAGHKMIQVPGNAHRTSPADDVMTRAQIRNNTIYFAGASGSAILVPGTDFPNDEGDGYVVANNAVYYAGPSGTCFELGLTADRFAFVGNNACYRGTWGTTYDATPHVTADPLFTNPPTDFTPTAGSPLIGAGSAAYAPATDLTLKTRPNPPSIGAYEP